MRSVGSDEPWEGADLVVDRTCLTSMPREKRPLNVVSIAEPKAQIQGDGKGYHLVGEATPVEAEPERVVSRRLQA